MSLTTHASAYKRPSSDSISSKDCIPWMNNAEPCSFRARFWQRRQARQPIAAWSYVWRTNSASSASTSLCSIRFCSDRIFVTTGGQKAHQAQAKAALTRRRYRHTVAGATTAHTLATTQRTSQGTTGKVMLEAPRTGYNVDSGIVDKGCQGCAFAGLFRRSLFHIVSHRD